MPFSLNHSTSLDRLLQAEEAAHAIWRDLTLMRVRAEFQMHPALEEVAQSAWRAWSETSMQRAAVERVAMS